MDSDGQDPSAQLDSILPPASSQFRGRIVRARRDSNDGSLGHRYAAVGVAGVEPDGDPAKFVVLVDELGDPARLVVGQRVHRVQERP
jgi:hypothetical protein